MGTAIVISKSAWQKAGFQNAPTWFNASARTAAMSGSSVSQPTCRVTLTPAKTESHLLYISLFPSACVCTVGECMCMGVSLDAYAYVFVYTYVFANVHVYYVIVCIRTCVWIYVWTICKISACHISIYTFGQISQHEKMSLQPLAIHLRRGMCDSHESWENLERKCIFWKWLVSSRSRILPASTWHNFPGPKESGAPTWFQNHSTTWCTPRQLVLWLPI